MLFPSRACGIWTSTAVAAVLVLPGTVEYAQAQTRLSPSVSVSERYDSNVFFGALGPGQIQEDFVTTVSPQVTVTNRNSLFDAVVSGGATSEVYVNNPGLNYVGFNASLNAVLDRAVQQVIKGSKLSITEAFRFTPQLPAFFAPTDTGNALPPELVRGFQAARANSYTITHGATAGYAIGPGTNWTMGYTHSTIRFGQIFAQPGSGGTFFTTTYQMAQAALTHQVTARDTIGLSYMYSLTDFGESNTGVTRYDTHTVRGTYTRILNPYWTLSLGGGLVFLPPLDPNDPTAKSQVTHVIDSSLTYRYQMTTASLGYSRSVLPSVGVASAALRNDNITASLSQGFGPKWTASLNGNYGTATSDPAGVYSFTSYSYGGTLSYAFRRDTAMSLVGSATFTRQEFIQAFNNAGFSFDRNLAMLNLTAAWY